MANVLNWFEIPVTDMNRAIKFYCTIFGWESMYQQNMGGIDMAFFPMEGDGVGGALVNGDSLNPSTDGAVIYLNANPDLGIVESRIEGAGGKVLVPKTLVTEEIGYFAIFIDSEGNRVALHSNK